MMHENIKRIKLKAEEERVNLNDPISMDEIQAFQDAHQFVLPQELALFYTEIGNGCGMMNGFHLRGLEELQFDSSKVKEKFKFTNYWVWENDKADGPFDEVKKGNIELIDIGDSQSWHIITTGEEQGQMWFFTDVGIQPCAPRRGFLSWFEYWLDGNDYYFEDFELQ